MPTPSHYLGLISKVQRLAPTEREQYLQGRTLNQFIEDIRTKGRAEWDRAKSGLRVDRYTDHAKIRDLGDRWEITGTAKGTETALQSLSQQTGTAIGEELERKQEAVRIMDLKGGSSFAVPLLIAGGIYLLSKIRG